MSRIGLIQSLVRNGLYYLTEHALDEANIDGLDIYNIENAVLTGKIRRTWPKEGKYEIVGASLNNKTVGVVCRITSGGKIRIITVYEDAPKR